jgi:hypothetical protein
MDALKQALVLSDVATEESDDIKSDDGPLVTMYRFTKYQKRITVYEIARHAIHYW